MCESHARKNFTEARKLRVARYSQAHPVIATAERFGVHQQMVIRYRKKFGLGRKDTFHYEGEVAVPAALMVFFNV